MKFLNKKNIAFNKKIDSLSTNIDFITFNKSRTVSFETKINETIELLIELDVSHLTKDTISDAISYQLNSFSSEITRSNDELFIFYKNWIQDLTFENFSK